MSSARSGVGGSFTGGAPTAAVYATSAHQADNPVKQMHTDAGRDVQHVRRVTHAHTHTHYSIKQCTRGLVKASTQGQARYVQSASSSSVALVPVTRCITEPRRAGGSFLPASFLPPAPAPAPLAAPSTDPAPAPAPAPLDAAAAAAKAAVVSPRLQLSTWDHE